MPPQKRSIKHFFQPVSTPSQTRPASPPKQTVPENNTPNIRAKVQSTPSTRSTRTAVRKPTPSPSPSSSSTISDTPRDKAAKNIPPNISTSTGDSFGDSKRFLSNGEQVVLNSDSDTDSLPELDWGESTRESKPPTRAASTRSKDEDKDNQLREQAFRLFVQKAQKNAEIEREIAEAKAGLDEPMEDDSSDEGFNFSQETLENAVHDDDDPEKSKRLYLAMQRTNALRTETVFYLFGEKRDLNSVKDRPFPAEHLPKHTWTSSFLDQQKRDQAFVSGFAERVFRYQELPEELSCWMIDQVCIGRSDLLSEKYIHLLSSHDHLHALLDKARLDLIFHELGADRQAVRPQNQTPVYVEAHPAPTRNLPSSLRYVCRLLQTASSRLSKDAIAHSLYLLFHVCMDHSVNSNIDILHDVQGAIEALLCNTSDNKKLGSILKDVHSLLLTHIEHPVLQQKLVSFLPANCPLTAYFQRHLALSFLLHPTPVDAPLDSLEVTKLVHTYLDSLIDSVHRKETDYTSLAARVTMLDVAIGPGLSTVPYQPLISPPPSAEGPKGPASVPLSSEEKAFNKELDALAWRVESLDRSIVESGSLINEARLEAKTRVEELYHRLDHAVRIGGKKLQSMFGEDYEQQRGLLSKWLEKGRGTPAASAVDRDTSDVSDDEV